MNILLVDDEAVLVESMRIGLENMGYQVVEAHSARQALDLLDHGEHRIDLVVTDYLMPVSNGLELLLAIRENHPLLSVMIMTAYADMSMVITALKNHCTGFIEKPFNLDQLAAEIERVRLHHLQHKKLNRPHHLLRRHARQINNPLTVIYGLTEMILHQQSDDVSWREDLKQILTAARQIGSITRNILDVDPLKEDTIEQVK